MSSFHNAGMYFESNSTATKKQFKVSFPQDVYLTLRYTEDELAVLQKCDKSDKISDQLTMLSIMARKVEERTNDEDATKEIINE